MADLIGCIIDWHDNSADSNAVYLRELVPAGFMFADYNLTTSAAPYIVVSELTYAVEGQANNAYRIENVTVQFQVYSDERAIVRGILDELETSYQHAVLAPDNRAILGTPIQRDRHITFSVPDLYRGWLNLEYTCEKTAL